MSLATFFALDFNRRDQLNAYSNWAFDGNYGIGNNSNNIYDKSERTLFVPDIVLTSVSYTGDGVGGSGQISGTYQTFVLGRFRFIRGSFYVVPQGNYYYIAFPSNFFSYTTQDMGTWTRFNVKIFIASYTNPVIGPWNWPANYLRGPNDSPPSKYGDEARFYFYQEQNAQGHNFTLRFNFVCYAA